MYLEKNIRYLRKKSGMNQDEMAEIFYVERQTISSWETGKREPGIEMMIRIADFFDVTIDQLVREDLSKKYWRKL